MMPFCAAVDWGTSRFRLWLLAEDGKILNHRRTDEGLLQSAAVGFATVLERHLLELGCSPDLPVIICGMAGSRSGWIEANYLNVPVALSTVMEKAVAVPDIARDIRILPGIAQRNSLNPDVMRGEETQLFGMLAKDRACGRNFDLLQNRIICMPGTHSKWVRLIDDRVDHFTTFMTGELFELVSSRSVLKFSVDTQSPVDPENPMFLQSMQKAIERPEEFSAQLFSLRPAMLLGYTNPVNALAALSGALIGLEFAGAFKRFGKPEHITLMASNNLGRLYATALRALEMKFDECNAEDAGLHGLLQAARHLWPANFIAK